jgi:hypothetical protein
VFNTSSAQDFNGEIQLSMEKGPSRGNLIATLLFKSTRGEKLVLMSGPYKAQLKCNHSSGTSNAIPFDSLFQIRPQQLRATKFETQFPLGELECRHNGDFVDLL